MKIFLLLGCICCLSYFCHAQGSPTKDEPKKEDESYAPLTVKINESGTKYIRFITWLQMWGETNNISGDTDLSINPRVRRSRLLAYAQISPRFLILTHFGLNDLNANGLTATGVQGNVG